MKHTFIYDCDICDRPVKTPLKITVDVNVSGLDGFYGELLYHYELCPECFRRFKAFMNGGGEREQGLLQKLG